MVVFAVLGCAVLGCLVGLGLAVWRYSVYALVPITLIAWLGLAATLNAAGVDTVTTVKTIVVWTVCLDVGYLLAAIFLPALKAHRRPFFPNLLKSISACRQPECRDLGIPPKTNEGFDVRSRS
jgi:hypothetical protein